MDEMGCQQLDRILEAAVIVSWADLMPKCEKGLIHVEYDFAANGTLKNLQIWSSTIHGYWHLVCTYTSPSGFKDGKVQFEDPHTAERLAQVLEFVMQHQDRFVLPPNLGRKGLLQIATPSAKESTSAALVVSEILEHANSTITEPVVV
jgi:hypothetical protein